MLRSPLLAVPHGFTTRTGGVSPPPFDTLNLGLSTADDPKNVLENRRRVLALFGDPPQAGLRQVHGATVHAVEAAGEWEGDGLLTHTPGLLLRVSVADCYPILLHEPVRGVVGALHAGWRGVVQGILPRALALAQARYGADPAQVRVAVGPGIGGCCYQVGPEVVEAFEQAGLPFYRPDSEPGRFRLDLEAAIRAQALQAGVRAAHYWALGACTYTDSRFFSYRRERNTGRMWAVIMLAPT
ncbi:peptidoglycan editing factor PgeF [Meiothermus sp. QL-1]|uniref:peptidoglycan editing factor PgeF n=1 Tax=Meiothermus sp. QL-1 TaxID=2058095 RepID=UPI001F22CE4C|nr:peptidoglycan editing factor PgeF [Meiothermus sp. QL-1]